MIYRFLVILTHLVVQRIRSCRAMNKGGGGGGGGGFVNYLRHNVVHFREI